MKERILLITRELVPFYYGGIGTQFKALAKILAGAGHEVALLTQRHDTFDRELFDDHYPNCRLFFTDVPHHSGESGFSYSGGLISHFNLCYALAVQQAFDGISEEFRPSRVVCADYGAESFFCLLKKLAGEYSGCQFVQFLEGSTHDSLRVYESGIEQVVFSELDEPQNLLTCAMEDFCIRSSDLRVAPTRVAWQEVAERLDLQVSPEVIPNLVEDGFFSSGQIRVDRRTSQTILFVGRLDYHKGADLLLQSFIDRYASQTSVTPPLLRFVGRDGFCKQYGCTFLEYWSGRIPEKLRGFIDFTGQVDPQEVRAYMAEATLAVFPSRWEVFGIVCLEAMASGCPTAVSAHTGLAEVVGDDCPDFKLDFTRDGEALYNLFEQLCAMDEADYDRLCESFQRRAMDVADMGRTGALNLFESTPPSSQRGPLAMDRAMLGDLITCLTSISRIASVLGHDVTEISRALKLDEDSLKRVLAPGGGREA